MKHRPVWCPSDGCKFNKNCSHNIIAVQYPSIIIIGKGQGVELNLLEPAARPSDAPLPPYLGTIFAPNNEPGEYKRALKGTG